MTIAVSRKKILWNFVCACGRIMTLNDLIP